VQGTDGNFYGTSSIGGKNNAGTVFRITPAGALMTLHSFCSLPGCTDGQYPNSALVLGTDGTFYGTTGQGGTGSTPYGTVFKITPQGKLTTVYNFCPQSGCADGAFPAAPMVQGTDGNFYGSTYEGGTNNFGVLFKVSPKGQFSRIYSFCSKPGCADGEYPSYGALVRGLDGNFYGTTNLGGANGDYGTVFKVTPAGKLTTLYSFCSQSSCMDGIYPAGLVRAPNGNFYSTATAGGICLGEGNAQGCGTVFEITPSGKLTTLYVFCAQTECADGANPTGLVQATDGNFYGATSQGGKTKDGTFNGGSIFKITPAGILTTLYAFCSLTNNCSDGSLPNGLVQSTGGSFWGITEAGTGTVFKLGVGLGPFVETLPTSRKVGATVTILGNSLTGSTSVTFNGKSAAFTVISASEITAVVPAGATTGKVKVVTPHGMLISNAVFSVTP
jgi:uncharacterized repeat protein (TIGR03803 family)